MTWNERRGCEADVPQLPVHLFDEVFAIDNGSSDGTAEYLQQHGVNVFRQDLPTYNGAYLCAFQKVNADAIVFFHPKGTINTSSLEQFPAMLRSGHDFVVASRMIQGARNEEDQHYFRPRKWFVLGLGAYSYLRWAGRGPVIWDVLHGYRALSRSAFERMTLTRQGITMDLEMVIQSYKLGLRAAEVPVQECERAYSSTHFKAIPTGAKLLRFLAKESLILQRQDRSTKAAASRKANNLEQDETDGIAA